MYLIFSLKTRPGTHQTLSVYVSQHIVSVSGATVYICSWPQTYSLTGKASPITLIRLGSLDRSRGGQFSNAKAS